MHQSQAKSQEEVAVEADLLICESLTDYKFDYTGFFGKSQTPRKLLKTNGRGRGI